MNLSKIIPALALVLFTIPAVQVAAKGWGKAYTCVVSTNKGSYSVKVYGSWESDAAYAARDLIREKIPGVSIKDTSCTSGH